MQVLSVTMAGGLSAETMVEIEDVVLESAEAFRVRFLNVPTILDETFASIDDAIAAGARRGFEFAVDDAEGNVVASWSPIGGARRFDR